MFPIAVSVVVTACHCANILYSHTYKQYVAYTDTLSEYAHIHYFLKIMHASSTTITSTSFYHFYRVVVHLKFRARTIFGSLFNQLSRTTALFPFAVTPPANSFVLTLRYFTSSTASACHPKPPIYMLARVFS